MIPVPTVLSWSDTSENDIGAEYIFMAPVNGEPLPEHWESISTTQRSSCIQSITNMMKKMTDLEFPAYGSIYFHNAPILDDLKIPLDDGFCVGPDCDPKLWNCDALDRHLYGHNRLNASCESGPWPTNTYSMKLLIESFPGRDLNHYFAGLIASARSRIPEAKAGKRSALSFQGTRDEHVKMLKVLAEVIKKLFRASILTENARPTLLHQSFTCHDTYVSKGDPTVITRLIGWQSASIKPTFAYANYTPNTVDDRGQPIFTVLSKMGDGPDPNDEDPYRAERKQWAAAYRQNLLDQGGIWTGLQLIEECVLRPVRFCNTIWQDGIAVMRQDLMKLSKAWSSLGLPGSCLSR
jgi:hypothetical protein